MKNSVTISTIIYKDKFIGLKESKINNNNIRILQFNKNILNNIVDHSLLKNSSIYFLFNKNEIYIGKTNNLFTRMMQHSVKKEFNHVVAFVMDNNDLSETFINYIEYFYIENMRNVVNLMNKAPRLKPTISKFDENPIFDLISNINNLLEFVFCIDI